MKPLVSPGARPRRYFFPLTPLADALFQLLVFFMLSSSLSPYALIDLTPGAAGAVADVTLAPAAGDPAVWRLGHGTLRAGAEVVALPDLAAALPALLGGADRVVLFPARAATVQDVASVLEVLALAGVTQVQLVPAAGG